MSYGIALDLGTSGFRCQAIDIETKKTIDRCPLCGIALNENGVCPKCVIRSPV